MCKYTQIFPINHAKYQVHSIEQQSQTQIIQMDLTRNKIPPNLSSNCKQQQNTNPNHRLQPTRIQ